MQMTLLALGALAVLTVISFITREKSEFLKFVLFLGMVFIIILNTSFLVGSTILLNQKSVTKGPVHYHADFEIWSCGQKLDLINPTGLDNKVGTAILHEHNDERIHVEGAVLNFQDISLGQFFNVVGGNLGKNTLTVPTDSGAIKMESGSLCQGQVGEVAVFVFKTEGKTFSQQKLEDPASYILSTESRVPPGDCIIIEFDKVKDKTDKMCTFYKIEHEKGNLKQK